MKKLLSALLAVMLMVSLVACGTGDSGKVDLPTIYFWSTGSQNVSDAFTKVFAAYNAKADRKANVELQFVLSGSGDATLDSRLAAAYKTGQKNSGFDIVAENGTSLQAYIDEAGSEDLFIDVDTSKMSNFANVKMEPSILKSKLVPYRGTTVVLAYNSEKLPNPPKTWDELVTWVKANPGRFTYNTPDSGGAGSAFVYNAIYRFLPDEARSSNDPKYAEMYDEGFKWLAMIHPYLYQSGGHVQYPVKNQGALDLLGSGEVWLTPAWADGTLTGIEAGTLDANTKMYQFSDGSLTGTDVDMAITSIGTDNVDACYDIINYVISNEAQQMFVDNMKAVPVVDAATLEQTDSVKAVSALNPANFAHLSIGDLGNKIRERWTADIASLN